MTAGVPGGGTPSPCPRPRACGLRGGGQRALPAVASAAPRAAHHGSPSAPGGRVRGKLLHEPAGAFRGGKGRKGQGGHRASRNHVQRTPPRCARKGRPRCFYRQTSLAYRGWPRPSGALIGRGRPHGRAVPRLPARIGSGAGPTRLAAPPHRDVSRSNFSVGLI